MKALTMWQPWASLLADGLKKNETRPRRLLYDGPIAIHAGLRPPERGEVMPMVADLRKVWNVLDAISDELIFQQVCGLPRGAVLAVCRFGPPQRSEAFTSTPFWPEYSFGNFEPGRFFMPVKQRVKLATPLPQVRGKQGLWDLQLQGPACEILLDALDELEEVTA